MREHMLPVKITIPFPYGKADKNGTIYTKEAVEKAITHLSKNIPIIYKENSETFNDIVLGHTTGDCHTVIWDSDNQVFKVTVDGVIYAGGTSCIVHDMDTKEKTVTRFEITGLGISVLGKDENVEDGG